MQVDYIIIGGGISGSFLSYYLLKEGKTVLVIDDEKPNAATKVASGVINPVTGRRVVSTWMIDDLLPFIWDAYNEMSHALQEQIITQKNVLAFPASFEMKEAYNKRLLEENSFIKPVAIEKEKEMTSFFNFIFSCVEISPAYLINLHTLLQKWKEKLLSTNSLLIEVFDESHLQIKDEFVLYKNIAAQKIIYCNGIAAYSSPYWKNLPATFIKGEALIAQINDLPTNNIYKIGSLMLTPWYNDLWWIGSSYENNYADDTPTGLFRKQKLQELSMFLKSDLKIQDQVSSIRPATVERRPFAGLHPQHINIGILNGMGTKGCSLAPWFAKQFAKHLVHETAIDSTVDVKRFTRLLSRI